MRAAHPHLESHRWIGLVCGLAALLTGCAGPASAIPSLISAAAPQRVEATGTPTDNLAGAPLVDQLRAGGLIIVLRNTAVDRSNASNNLSTGECVRRFSLSQDGRQRARLIGSAFRRLKIPVGAVFTSVSCHTLEMAQIAFGHARFDDGLNPTNLDGIDPQVQTEALKALLARRPADGSNTILITHGQNISTIVNATPGEGAALIFRPDGYGGVALLAHIDGNAWADLQ